MDSEDNTAELQFLSTVEGEIAFFRALMRARPVGIHRHFHVLNIRNGILKDTGQSVSIPSVWEKLRTLYDMDALEGIDMEVENYESRTAENTIPSSPSPSENLAAHPFFREEYTLPYDAKIEEIISRRRMRDTPSPVPPTPSPQPVTGRTRASRKRGKSKLDLAGLVGGDSDSSALTQESGDEGVPPTPRDSVTITEGGTEYGDEDTEMRDASPDPDAPSPTGKTTRKKPAKKAVGRPRGSTSGRATKKRKR
ncbi:chromatin modification-related protein EAF7-domain-containing protein [Roridomyces roridus]|uniref:Chromatin modification-related protein EAF7-domain-containing protein n=1 Tax=Roridomyces roridus TaxID=1738132 RepID=A0AAD7CDB0_9AGAR|nr:chromatin modification-related protein EAF7-domain-containing protein [Roridomyces roridus]